MGDDYPAKPGVRSIADLAAEHWKSMTVEERRNFLRAAAEMTSRTPEAWGKKSIEELAKIEIWMRLPHDLRQKLEGAARAKGFSIKKFREPFISGGTDRFSRRNFAPWAHIPDESFDDDEDDEDGDQYD